MPNLAVTIKDGSLYFSAALCRRFFDGLQCVILLRRDNDLCILPVRHQAGGGYLLKMRNIAGDRVVHAPDFFSEHNVPIDVREFAAEWSSADQALIIAHAFDL